MRNNGKNEKITRKTMNKRLASLVASVVVVSQVASTAAPVFATGENNVDGIIAGEEVTEKVEEKVEEQVEGEVEGEVGSEAEGEQVAPEVDGSEENIEDTTESTDKEVVKDNVVVSSGDVYTLNFDETDTKQPNWKNISGGGSLEVKEGNLEVKRTASSGNSWVFFDQNAPMLVDGDFETEFTFEGGNSRFGLILRPTTDDQWLFVGYNNNGKWMIETQSSWKDDIDGPALEEDKTYKLNVRLEGNKITIWLDGEQIFSDIVNVGGMQSGQAYGVGFRTWYDSKTVKVNYLKAGAVGSIDPTDMDKEIQSIEEVSVTTEQYVAPILPEKVNVIHSDGSKGTRKVTWNYVDKADYEKVGEFTVEGTVDGTDVKAVAKVTVTQSQSGIVPPDVVVEEKTLESETMNVILDNNFPRVIRYEWKEDGAILEGEDEQLFIVELNDEKFVPKVEFNQIDARTADYTMKFEEINLTMKVRMSLAKDDVLRMEVISIDESVKFMVQTINFPGHSLASVKDVDNGQLSGVRTVGDWNNIKEEFVSIADTKVGNYPKTYGIINNDDFAITVDNNVINGGNRVAVNVEQRNGYKKAGISNGTWTYREPLKSTSDSVKFIGEVAGIEITDENPADGTQVVIDADNSIKPYMGKEYEAVYVGLGGVEDFEGLDLTGKVALIDRGTHTFVDKAKNAKDAGAVYAICMNNVEGLVPAQGNQEALNMLGISLETGNKIKANLNEDGTTTVNLSIKGVGSDDVVPGADKNPEELPWSQIMIARDKNENGKVNWQDAAILYRDNMDEVDGADMVRNSFSYIPFNIGSLTQAPFLRTGDMIKKLSNYTDGFGQLILEKGYQGEGHDDVIADIGGHTGIRQGGKDDLNKLIEIGKGYNAEIGVHVNVTEYHLDAFEFDVNNLKSGFQKGWSWKDDSYYVDQRLDITTGELTRRFDMLKEDHPDLGWIYIDVYTGNEWNAKELAEEINNRGWMAATEFNGPLEQQVAWTHWGGDPAYPNRGNESKITRFIRNQEQDVYMSDDLLKGGKHMLSGGWGTRHDVEGFYAIETFYNQTLPSKYMQHFEIQEWEDNGQDGGFVRFNDNLISIRENGNINMYKDDKLIATTKQSTIDERGIGKTNLFIPWTWEQLNEKDENKVYHWNPYGGETTWSLPNGWEGTQTIKLYELSDLGKTFVEEIPVVNGQVTINAEKNTPYVVFQEKVSEDRIDNWGEGTLINDPGFDSQTFDHWEVETTAENTDHINIINEQVDRRKGNDVVMIQGEAYVDPLLIPQSQMTATASTVQAGEGPENAIDGQEGSIWHSSYSGATFPAHITLDLGGEYEVDKFTYLPRQSGDNGKIYEYELQVSTDGENFTKVAEGEWDKSTSLKTITFDKAKATHVRLVANTAHNNFVSVAELNVYRALGDGEELPERKVGADAKLSQEITGLEPGKTYSASAWVKTSGDREVTFGMEVNGEKHESTIDRETTRVNVGEGLKWHGEKITRMRVEFTVPEGVTTGTLYVNVAEDEFDSKVIIDDFRIWTNPLGTSTNRDGYVLYEDFENVDEGHGPFYMGQNLGTDNRTHYAEKNPEGGQYMNWVISDRFSLKTNQQEGTTGDMLVTDQSTLQLKPNTTYELGFKYTNKKDNLYSISIKSATAGVLFKDNLTPGEVVGRPEDGANYSREVKEYTKEFTTGDVVDYYLALEKTNDFDEFIMDDLYIKEISQGEDRVAVTGIELNKTTDSVKVEDTIQLKATLSPEDATNKNVTWESSNENVATVDEDGNVTGVGAGKATITVTTVDGGFKATCELTVNPKWSLINHAPVINVESEEVTINVGDEFDPMAGVTAEDKEDGNITSSVKVVESTVDTTKAGEYKVVYSVVDSKGATTTKEIKVTVVGEPDEEAKLSEVTLKLEKETLKLGETSKTDLIGKLSDGTEVDLEKAEKVTFEISKPEVLKVEKGIVTALSKGVAEISVTATLNGVSVKSNTVKVTVDNKAQVVAVKSVKLDKSNAKLEVGQSQQLKAKVKPENATNKNVTWKSSNEKIATVVDGKVVAKGVGTATITVTTVDGSYTDTCKVQVYRKGELPQTGGASVTALFLTGISMAGAGILLKKRNKK